MKKMYKNRNKTIAKKVQNDDEKIRKTETKKNSIKLKNRNRKWQKIPTKRENDVDNFLSI